MKVIGVGFGRTGTNSLSAALDQLGFGPCYHMFDIVEKPRRIQGWLAAARGERVSWDEMFSGFSTVMDFPAVAFWREITAHYPDAKVILTVRDPYRWYESAAKTIFRNSMASENGSMPKRLVFPLITRLSPDFGAFNRMIEATVIQRLFDGTLGDRAHAIEMFERHVDEVVKEIPEDRLLVYDVSQGWAPLCAFLGVAPPDGMPFPHGNGVEAFRREEGDRMRRLIIRSMLRRSRS